MPGVRITADTVNNTLLIYANQESYRIIEQTLRQLDRPQLQVAIDATIAEITLNDSLSYGVQFFIKGMDVGAHDDKGSVGLSTGASAIIARTLPGFNFLLGPELEPRMILQETKVALAVLVDTSASSTPADLERASQLSKTMSGAQGRHWMRVVPFARSTRALTSGEQRNNIRLTATTGEAGRATDLEAAVREAIASLPSGMVPRVALISDGPCG